MRVMSFLAAVEQAANVRATEGRQFPSFAELVLVGFAKFALGDAGALLESAVAFNPPAPWRVQWFTPPLLCIVRITEPVGACIAPTVREFTLPLEVAAYGPQFFAPEFLLTVASAQPLGVANVLATFE